ncbi:hypothetical protein OPT61_g3718 [Boeremia exigua]|uniref:Uncharacterized protein n=1 Tax=Boeremia exigua TaxID=749465 RepID=A0ACC2IGW5_9PLEO|nr:hypothetical protein OPT61_g3718 [Boeremia exigua]
MLFTAKPKRYSHQPLVYWKSQIRLLRVEPDLYGPIRCKVEIFDLNRAPAYAALSYTWGPEYPVYDILIDGKALSVRKNLHHFLKCRRKTRNKHYRSEKDLYIFIDQICIDQSDPEERNRQVQLMSRIYSRCWQVIIWLNDEQGQCTRAARDFGHVSKRALSLAKLLKNDYFTRLWIVQELLLAPSICVFTPGNTWLSWRTILQTTRDVMSGTHMTPEESAAWKMVPVNTSKLVLMTDKFACKRQFDPQKLKAPNKLSWFRFAAKAGHSSRLSDLLGILHFGANICHEPRDKVYGLMSLLEVEHQLTVDYNKPVYDVFKDAIIELHSIVDFDDDNSYRQWLKATRQLGVQMGIDNNDIAELFALLEFINLILPTRGHSVEGEAGCLPSLVSMVGVRVSNTRGVQLDPMVRTMSRSAYSLGSHDVNDQEINESTDDIHDDKKSDDTVVEHYLGLPPDIGRRQSSDGALQSNQPKAHITIEYDIIQEIALYLSQGEDQDPILKEKRWNSFVHSLTYVSRLDNKGVQVLWYFLHDGKTFRYKTSPDWDRIFQISPFRMARIIKEYEEERIEDEKSRKEHQQSSEDVSKAQPECATPQVTQKPKKQHKSLKKATPLFQLLVYWWLCFVGFAVAVVGIICCAADTISHAIPVVFALWGLYRVFKKRNERLSSHTTISVECTKDVPRPEFELDFHEDWRATLDGLSADFARDARACLSLLPAALALMAPVIVPRAGAPVSGRYIVKMKPIGIEKNIITALKQLGRNPAHIYSFGNFKGFAAELSETTLALLRWLPGIEYIEQEIIFRASLDDTDPVNDSFVTQTSSPWGLARISSQNRGSTSYTYDDSAGSGTCVYVVDTGIAISHPEFEGRASFLANFAGDGSNADDHGHGTHCAGIVGSRTYGVAKNTTIYGVKVLDATASGTTSSVVAGINFVVNDVATRNCPNGAILSMSLGGMRSAAVNSAAANAVSSGIFVVAAAGNNAKDTITVSPASESTVFAVGATDSVDRMASFSNFGTLVDILAPGVSVLSTWLNNSTILRSGTSMATPHVAGIAAYLLALEGKKTPAALSTYMQVLALKGNITNLPLGTKNYLASNGNARS